MKHRRFGNHLSRSTNQAKALRRGLLLAVFEKGRIETSLSKAKIIQGVLERLITLGKQNAPAAQKLIVREMGTERAVAKVIKTAARFAEKTSGYSRIKKLGPRLSDATEMATLELVGQETLNMGTNTETMDKQSLRSSPAKPDAGLKSEEIKGEKKEERKKKREKI